MQELLSGEEAQNDYEKLMEYTEKLGQLNSQLEALYEEWEEAGDTLSELEESAM